jgi:hypothetical protein
VVTALALAVSLLASCDLASRDSERPPLHVLETVPANGAGTDCSRLDPSCGVPLRTTIRVRFDRPLWPEPLNFEAVRVYTGTPSNRVAVTAIDYSVFDWTLSFRLGRPLAPRTLYQVELPGWDGTPGPRAYDGAELEPGGVPLRFSFVTSDTDASDLAPVLPSPSCEQAVAVFEAHCSTGACHGGETPAMGLRLDSRAGLRSSALRRVARQTETASTVGVPHSHPARFGTAMPLLDPGNAANSYLFYKLFITPQGFGACAHASCEPFSAVEAGATCEPWPEAERQRLRDWFVRGEAMPLLPSESGAAELAPLRPLDCASLRALIRFVDAGAECAAE